MAWLKQVGDPVQLDEPLVLVETDKVSTEIPSPVAGVLVEQLVADGDTVVPGAVLARLEDPPPSDTAAAGPAGAAAAPTGAPEPAADAPVVAVSGNGAPTSFVATPELVEASAP